MDDSSPDSFKVRYRNEPVAFARDCIMWRTGQGLTAYQEEILTALVTRKRVSARGPHGLGKTALAAIAIWWFALTRDGEDWKIPTTASAWRQLSKFLWPEIHKWGRRLRWDVIGRKPPQARAELLGLSIKLQTGEAFAVASDTPELIEGAHADCLFYVFDESKTIPGETFDAAEGAFAGAGADTEVEALALSISTPGEPQGRFYEIQSRKPGYEDWWVRAITLEETVQAGRVSSEWVEQRKRQWGEQSAVFLNRVKGEFASSDEEGVVPLSWVEAAVERWYEWAEAGRSPDKLNALGVDVGLSGDKTVFARRYGHVIAELEYRPKEDPKIATMATAGAIKGILDANASATAIVDVIGIGAGVVHRLNEQGMRVVGFNAAERTDRRDRSGEIGYANKRSEAWWTLRELLDPSYDHMLALPPDDILIGDLTAPHYRILSGGKLLVESKTDIRARLGRSTDAGDSVIQAFYEPPTDEFETDEDVVEDLVEYTGR